MHKKKSIIKYPTNYSDSRKTFAHPYEIACKFNYFFVNVDASLEKKEKIKNQGGSPLDYVSVCFPSLKTFKHSDINEIQCIIGNLKPTASGHNEVRTSLVKEVKSFIADPLTFVFSMSLDRSIVPKDLKLAKVIPILNSWSFYYF